MKVSKREFRTIRKALGCWTQENLLTEQQQQTLNDSIEVKQFDWQGLARYSFWVAISCMLIALLTVLLDEELLTLIKQLFNAPLLVKSGFCLLLALMMVGYGVKIRRHSPKRIFSYDTLFFLGMLGIASSIFFLGAYLDTGTGHYPPLILLGAFIYLTIGWGLVSGLIWISGLLTLVCGVVLEMGFQSGWESHFMGMNYTLRLLFIAIVVLFMSYGLKTVKPVFFKSTEILSLFLGFTSLWLLSINGNTEDWNFPGHKEVVPWILGFAVASLVIVFLGTKLNDDLMRGFGLVFLFTNIYTRFFEYVWDEIHGALFFAILAMSFWLISRYAEKLWLFGR